MNTELERSKLIRNMERDLGVTFVNGNFRSCGHALVWHKDPRIGYTSQAVITLSGKIIFQSSGMLNEQEIGLYLINEPQLTPEEVEQIKIKILLDEIHSFRKGRAVVCQKRKKPHLHSKFNYVTMNGEVISELWFDKAEPFLKNFALVVQEPERYNFIRLDGSLLFDKWLAHGQNFCGEYAVIKKQGSSSYQLMNSKGEVLEDKYDLIIPYASEQIIVQKKGKFNLLNQNLEPMLGTWPSFIRDIYPFSNGRALIKEHSNTFNYLGLDGSWLFRDEFGLRKSLRLEGAYPFNEGFAVVQDYFPHRGSVSNFIDPEGKFLSRKWFNSAACFDGGYARVETAESEWNFIDSNGKMLHPDGFHGIPSPFFDGLALVFLKDDPQKPRFIKKSGEFLDHPELSDARSFIHGRALVEIDGEFSNFLTLDGNFLLPNHYKIGALRPDLTYAKGEPDLEELKSWTEFGHLNWFGEILD